MGDITRDLDLRPGWRRWSPSHLLPAFRRKDHAAAPAPGMRVPLPRAGSDWAAFHEQQNANTRKVVLGIGAISLGLVIFAFSGSSEPDPVGSKAPASPVPAARPALIARAAPEPAADPAAVAPAPVARDQMPSAPAPAVPAPAPVVSSRRTPSPGGAPIVINATRELEDAPEEKPSRALPPTPLPPPPPSDGRGALHLTSEPDVTVYEGDRRLGTTPLEVRLLPGRHQLRLVDRAKHLEEKHWVEIRAGQTHTEELSFGIGTLRVQAPDGTKLYVDSKLVGTAPFKGIDLVEGEHRIKVQRGAETMEDTITVPASHAVDYRVRFAED